MLRETEQTGQALEAAAAAYPDLRSWLELHRPLWEAQRALEASLEPLPSGRLSLRAEVRRRARQPLFRFPELQVDPGAFREAAARVREILGSGSPLPSFPEARAWYEAGQEAGSPRTVLVQEALRPFLHRALDGARTLLEAEEEGYWDWPRCPLCGGPPDLALLDGETGARHLVCARCDGRWRYRRIGCPYCGIRDPARLAYFQSLPPYRLYVCEACGRYLKTVEAARLTRPFVPWVERAITAGLDLAARQAGYGTEEG